VAAAKAAAGTEFAGVFSRIARKRSRLRRRPRASCDTATRRTAASLGMARRTGKGVRQSLLPRSDEYSVWAVTTSAGIILIDSIFDYSVDDEVVGGLKKLGWIRRPSNTS